MFSQSSDEKSHISSELALEQIIGTPLNKTFKSNHDANT